MDTLFPGEWVRAEATLSGEVTGWAAADGPGLRRPKTLADAALPVTSPLARPVPLHLLQSGFERQFAGLDRVDQILPTGPPQPPRSNDRSYADAKPFRQAHDNPQFSGDARTLSGIPTRRLADLRPAWVPLPFG